MQYNLTTYTKKKKKQTTG